MKTLRPYQESAVQSLFDWLFNRPGHPLVVAPVASGKSLMIAEFIKRAHTMYPGTKTVMLSHVKELLVQDANEMREQWPEADFGFYCAGLGEKIAHRDITFASIQSIWNKVDAFPKPPNLVIIDEVHLVSHNSLTRYRKFIDSVLRFNPNAKVCGFTGTPFRADTGRLDEGEDALFDGAAYNIGIDFMIDNGYLCPPVTPKVDTEMDVSGVATRGGDYIASQLEEAVDVDDLTKACVKEMIEKASNRKKWLVFTAGITHCQHVCEALNLAGVPAKMVTGKTPKAEREQILREYSEGKFRALVNVAVLTTGYNEPAIDMLAFMRPTRSPVLYLQTIGRGLRTAPGKKDCLILDFGGVIKELGPIDQIDIRKTNKLPSGDGEAIEAVEKRCPSCGTMCAAQQRYCYSCNYCFFELELETSADSQSKILSEPETHEVLGMSMKIWTKKDSEPDDPKTLRVSYSTPGGTFHEWLCFEHWQFTDNRAFAYKKAEQWHNARLPGDLCPSSCAAAEIKPYPCPSHITVKKEGKYWRVIDYKFEEKEEVEEIPF